MYLQLLIPFSMAFNVKGFRPSLYGLHQSHSSPMPLTLGLSQPHSQTSSSLIPRPLPAFLPDHYPVSFPGHCIPIPRHQPTFQVTTSLSGCLESRLGRAGKEVTWSKITVPCSHFCSPVIALTAMPAPRMAICLSSTIRESLSRGCGTCCLVRVGVWPSMLCTYMRHSV